MRPRKSALRRRIAARSAFKPWNIAVARSGSPSAAKLWNSTCARLTESACGGWWDPMGNLMIACWNAGARIAVPMSAVKAVFRFYSYLFHAILALFLIALSGVTIASGVPNLQLGMLPWTGPTLVHVLLFGSLFGLVTVFLTLRGILVFRVLFLLWALAVVYFLVKGYILSGYRFAPEEFTRACWLTGGA